MLLEEDAEPLGSFFVGFGVGGLYCVDLPLVQEFVQLKSLIEGEIAEDVELSQKFDVFSLCGRAE